MKKLILTIAFSLLTFGACAFGQTLLGQTTLSAAVNGPGSTTAPYPPVTVASATGIVANATVLYVDNEAMFVEGISGTTLTVQRGYQSAAHAHASGALVWFSAPNNFFNEVLTNVPAGSCTRSNERVLPHINLTYGIILDCLGGTWVSGTNSPLPPWHIESPDPGGVLYTGINTNGTTLAATTMYCTEINLHENKYLTGLGVLNGTTATTDNHLVALYDASGNLLANSAAAGAVASGASVYQNFAFTSKYFAVGPAQYFGCMQTNGTTATVRMAVTGQGDNVLTKGVTAQTFGTVPATITVPTTFTTAVGPFFLAY